MNNPIFIESSSREDELLCQGWTKRFSASGSRLQEATELYKSMGLEVHLEPVQVEDLACSECFQGPVGTLGDCYVIYTRPAKNREDRESAGSRKGDDDLW